MPEQSDRRTVCGNLEMGARINATTVWKSACTVRQPPPNIIASSEKDFSQTRHSIRTLYWGGDSPRPMQILVPSTHFWFGSHHWRMRSRNTSVGVNPRCPPLWLTCLMLDNSVFDGIDASSYSVRLWRSRQARTRARTRTSAVLSLPPSQRPRALLKFSART